MARAAAIVGTGQTKHTGRREDVNVPELLREAAAFALEDAGITARDVDAVVIGSGPEEFEGVNQPEHWVGPAIGAPGKPVMRIQTGGTSARSTTIGAFYHVASGLFDVVLAVAYQKLSDGVARYGLSYCHDPLWDRDYARGRRGACRACSRASTWQGTIPGSARSTARWSR